MSEVDVEVRKLKEASEKVKFRLEKLDRRQKRIICNLFVEKVEMRRERANINGKEKWKATADIFFRFNPEKFKTPLSGVEPKHGSVKGNTASKSDILDEFGGRGGI